MASSKFSTKEWAHIRQFTINSLNIILREVTYLDVLKRRDDHRKYRHVNAYHRHAFGILLGSITFCNKTGIIHACQTSIPETDLITVLLIDDVKRRIGGDHSISLSKDMREISYITSLIQQPIGMYIGAGISDQFCDELGKMYRNLENSSMLVPTIPMKQLIIECTIRYRPILAGAGHETPHGLFLYPSVAFAQGDPIFIPYMDADGVTTHKLVFDTQKEHLTSFAYLNCYACALFKNASDTPCVNQSGFTSIRLVELYDNIKKRVSRELFVPNSKLHHSKGVIVITCSAINMKPNQTMVSETVVKKEYDVTHEKVLKYITRNQRFYDQFQPSAKAISRITVFNYDGCHGKIPGCMFDCFKIPASKEAFYLNVLRYAIQRRLPHEDITSPTSTFDVHSWSVDRDPIWCVSVVMDMLCIYVTHCKYITDVVDNNESGKTYQKSLVELIESFDPVRCRDAADCEDFVKEMLLQVAELKYNVDTISSIAMQHVQDILQQFIFVSALCGVSRASISFADKNNKDIQYGGHECVLAVPNYIFFTALARGNPSHELLSLYTREEMNRGKGDHIYVLEGTGTLMPEPHETTDAYDALSELVLERFSLVSVADIHKTFFYHPKKPDNFYKKIVCLLTSEPFLKTGYHGFEYLVCFEDPDHPKSFLRGVDFADLIEIDKHPDIRLVEAPKIPIKTFRAATRLNDDNFPPMVIEPVQITADMWTVAARLTILKPGAILTSSTEQFTFRIAFDEMNDTRALALYNDVTRYGLNMKCFPEAVKRGVSTHSVIGGYHFVIFK